MTMKERVKSGFRGILRYPINRKNRKRLINKEITIISSNCIGGILYHDLGLPFLSPTINLYIKPSDFVRLCGDLPYYMNIKPEEIVDKTYKFPVAKLGDIKIYCMHYENFNAFVDIWEKRKQRIVYDNCYFIMSERDGCTYEDIEAFNALKHEHKVVFVTKEMQAIESAIYFPEFVQEENITELKLLTDYVGKFSGKRIIDKFDYVGFFNQS